MVFLGGRKIRPPTLGPSPGPGPVLSWFFRGSRPGSRPLRNLPDFELLRDPGARFSADFSPVSPGAGTANLENLKSRGDSARIFRGFRWKSLECQAVWRSFWIGALRPICNIICIIVSNGSEGWAPFYPFLEPPVSGPFGRKRGPRRRGARPVSSDAAVRPAAAELRLFCRLLRFRRGGRRARPP